MSWTRCQDRPTFSLHKSARAGGFEFTDKWGAELGYGITTNFFVTNIDITYLSLIHTQHLGDKFSLSEKLGVLHWDADTNLLLSSENDKESAIPLNLSVRYNF